jgi:hypothetical protein
MGPLSLEVDDFHSMYNKCPDPDFLPTHLFPMDLGSSSDPLVSSDSDQQLSVTPSPTTWYSSLGSPTEHHIIQNPFDGVRMEQTQILTRLAKPPQDIPKSLSFMHYDPTNPQTCKTEKRHRDQAELDQQREDVAALKMFGGSCLWCIRTKKKCEAVRSCKPCLSHERVCYRNVSVFLMETSLMNPDLPSQEMRRTLAHLNQCVFQNSQQFVATINLFPRHEDVPWSWTVTKLNTIWPNHSDCPIASLVGMITESQSLNLVPLDLAHGTHPLVHTALNIAKLFTASHWLAQSKVLAQKADMTGGRLVVLHILVHCFYRLFESAVGFCDELYYALRKPQSKAKDGLDPIWVAAALYYRVACGLRDLQSNLVVGRILGPGYQIDGVCEAIERILWAIIPRRGVTDTIAKKKLLSDMVPILKSDKDVIMEYWQNPRPNNLQSRPSNEMEYFLFDEFLEPSDVPEGAALKGSELSMRMPQLNYPESTIQYDIEVAGVFSVNGNVYTRGMAEHEGLHVAGSLYEEREGLDVFTAFKPSSSNWQQMSN